MGFYLNKSTIQHFMCPNNINHLDNTITDGLNVKAASKMNSLLVSISRRFSHYNTLGISNKATAEEIKKAYFALSKKYHPDLQKNEDMEESLNKFIQIQDAYDVLSDTIIRKNYDAQHGFDTGTNREVKDISDEEIRNIIRRQSAKANKDSNEKKQSKDHNN